MIAIHDDHQIVPDGPPRRANHQSPPAKAPTALAGKDNPLRYMAAKKANAGRNSLKELFSEGEDAAEGEDDGAKANRHSTAFPGENDDAPKVNNGVDVKKVEDFLKSILDDVALNGKTAVQRDADIVPADSLSDFEDLPETTTGDVHKAGPAFEDSAPAIATCDAGCYSPILPPRRLENIHEAPTARDTHSTSQATEAPAPVIPTCEAGCYSPTFPAYEGEGLIEVGYQCEVLEYLGDVDEEMDLSTPVLDMEIGKGMATTNSAMDIVLDLEHGALTAPLQYVANSSLGARDQEMSYSTLDSRFQLDGDDNGTPRLASSPTMDNMSALFATLAIHDHLGVGSPIEIVSICGIKHPLCGGLRGTDIEMPPSKRQQLIIRLRRSRFDARLEKLRQQKRIPTFSRDPSELASLLPGLPPAALVIKAFALPPASPTAQAFSPEDTFVDTSTSTPAHVPITEPLPVLHAAPDPTSERFADVAIEAQSSAHAPSPALPLVVLPVAVPVVCSSTTDAFAAVPECLRYREPPKRENGRRSSARDALAQAKADRKARKAATATSTAEKENEDPAIADLIRMFMSESTPTEEDRTTVDTRHRSRAAPRHAPYSRPENKDEDEKAESVTPLPSPPAWLANKVLGMFKKFSGQCMDVDKSREEAPKADEERMEDENEEDDEEEEMEGDDECDEEEMDDDEEEEEEENEGGDEGNDGTEDHEVQLDEGEAPAFSDHESDSESDAAAR
ncbi:hypothetical protein CONPUDRAFT_169430 [Coniophora puteana RWD-64-598 SS2]|uniref:Uncharacterized protein n=1 Tax=Coniophora puteana (strain RWD-64-598) TaxID=741705 RepID=A0A5M3M9Z5_CONPW|nr:uncharacterized protein CONPUDRAFT_169430 [Coniophora puteana RWD-64-598 SS2]EIW75674.1 hypothetical protein CONPUDRAFT_169430 [Coniophora puteana RWD-64-598 SS2]